MFECNKCRIVYTDSSRCMVCGEADLPKEISHPISYVMRDQPV